MLSTRDKEIAGSPEPHDINLGSALLVTGNARQQTWGKRWLSRAGFGVTTAANVEETLACLADQPHTVVIVDARIRDVTGRSLYELVLEKRVDNSRVFVLCKSSRDMKEVAKYEDAEILRKPFDWQLLSRRIKRAAVSRDLVLQLEHARKALAAAKLDAADAARHVLAMRGIDTLTGLPGRERFVGQIARLKKDPRGDHSPAVLVVGIDHFELINEAVGHAAGNQVINQFAERLQALLEESSLLNVSESTTLMATVGRVTGVRFGMLLSVASVDEIKRIGNVVSDCFEDPFEIDGQSIYLSVTLGAARILEDGAPACNLLGLANQALDEARIENIRFKIFDPASANIHARSLMLEDMLHVALHRRQLRLVYQPIMDWHGRSVIAAEALLRWNHPDVGEVSPEEFMPIAERSDLIATINEFVIGEVVRRAADWAQDPDAPNRIGLNLSHAQLVAGNVVELMKQYLSRFSVAADRLQIEVREKDLLNKGQEVFDVIHQIKGLGVRIAIDQFGTGAFSVALLEDLPLDAVKIERARISAPRRDLRSDAIGSGIVAIVRRLDMSVTAVGIETDSDVQRLRNWGCDEFQGNLFSLPVSASDLTSVVIPSLRTDFRDTAALQATNSGLLAPNMRHESRLLKA